MPIQHFTSKGQTNFVNILNPNTALQEQRSSCLELHVLKQDATFLQSYHAIRNFIVFSYFLL